MTMRAAALALLLVSLAANAQPPSEGQAARDTEFDGLKLLGSQHQDRRLTALGIAVGYVATDTRPSEGMYLCGAMTREDAKDAGDSVATALQYLPDASLMRMHLRYVVLCGRATAGGQSIGGIPVTPLNLLMLDAAGDSVALQHRTLHELYHFAEYRAGTINDTEWVARFGGGDYANRYPALLRRSPIGSGKPGFINTYAEIHPHEDRAELFTYLVMAPREVAARIRTTGDPVLRQKAEYVIDKSQRILGMPLALPP
jgi:hypothetical protein